MKRWLLAWSLSGLCAAFSSAAQGQEQLLLPPTRLPSSEPMTGQPSPPPVPQPPPEGLLPPPLCAPPCLPSIDKFISVPRYTLVDENAATTIPVMKVRDVAVGRAQGLEVEFRETKRVVTAWVAKPRDVEQEVLCTTLVPYTVTDPCTGECHTDYKPCPVLRKVKVTLYDVVPEEQQVAVSVPIIKPGPPLEVRRVTVDTTMEPAIETRLRLYSMPNEIHVSVPACPPILPPCLVGHP